MNVKEFCGVDSFNCKPDGTEMTHFQKYAKVVDTIGLSNLIPLIPADLETVKMKLKEDRYLNNIPLKKWDINIPVTRSLMNRQCGINVSSMSDAICVLKTAAEIWVQKEDKN